MPDFNAPLTSQHFELISEQHRQFTSWWKDLNTMYQCSKMLVEAIGLCSCCPVKARCILPYKIYLGQKAFNLQELCLRIETVFLPIFHPKQILLRGPVVLYLNQHLPVISEELVQLENCLQITGTAILRILGEQCPPCVLKREERRLFFQSQTNTNGEGTQSPEEKSEERSSADGN